MTVHSISNIIKVNLCSQQVQAKVRSYSKWRSVLMMRLQIGRHFVASVDEEKSSKINSSSLEIDSIKSGSVSLPVAFEATHGWRSGCDLANVATTIRFSTLPQVESLLVGLENEVDEWVGLKLIDCKLGFLVVVDAFQLEETCKAALSCQVGNVNGDVFRAVLCIRQIAADSFIDGAHRFAARVIVSRDVKHKHRQSQVYQQVEHKQRVKGKRRPKVDECTSSLLKNFNFKSLLPCNKQLCEKVRIASFWNRKIGRVLISFSLLSIP